MVQQKKGLIVWLAVVAALLALSVAAGPPSVGPRLIAAGIVTLLLLLAALLLRVLAIPRFRLVPGRLQLALETIVGAFVRPRREKTPAYTAGYARAAAPRGPGFAERLKRLPGAVGGWVRRNKTAAVIWLGSIAVLLAASIAVGSPGEREDVQTVMRDAVLHDVNRIRLFLKEVNPALIAAMTVSGVLLLAAALIRVFVIPRFQEIPGKFQLVLETIVGTLDGMAGVDQGGKPTFIGAYVFAAGVYVFSSTLFELFGLQAVTSEGMSIALPAPLSDVNAAIAMGCLSYLVILGGGVVRAGAHGAGAALKEFSLPISMSFRLFGALLSGLLVTELVYHYVKLSFVLPVIVGVMFTLLHALVQAYVLTMLVGMYYREVTEKPKF